MPVTNPSQDKRKAKRTAEEARGWARPGFGQCSSIQCDVEGILKDENWNLEAIMEMLQRAFNGTVRSLEFAKPGGQSQQGHSMTVKALFVSPKAMKDALDKADSYNTKLPAGWVIRPEWLPGKNPLRADEDNQRPIWGAEANDRPLLRRRVDTEEGQAEEPVASRGSRDPEPDKGQGMAKGKAKGKGKGDGQGEAKGKAKDKAKGGKDKGEAKGKGKAKGKARLDVKDEGDQAEAEAEDFTDRSKWVKGFCACEDRCDCEVKFPAIGPCLPFKTGAVCNIIPIGMKNYDSAGKNIPPTEEWLVNKALATHDLPANMPAILINVKGQGAPPREERVEPFHWGYNPTVIGQVLADEKAIQHVGTDLAYFLSQAPGDIAQEWAIVTMCNHAKHRSVAWQGLLRGILRRLGYPSRAHTGTTGKNVCGPSCCPTMIAKHYQQEAFEKVRPFLLAKEVECPEEF